MPRPLTLRPQRNRTAGHGRARVLRACEGPFDLNTTGLLRHAPFPKNSQRCLKQAESPLPVREHAQANRESAKGQPARRQAVSNRSFECAPIALVSSYRAGVLSPMSGLERGLLASRLGKSFMRGITRDAPSVFPRIFPEPLTAQDVSRGNAFGQ